MNLNQYNPVELANLYIVCALAGNAEAMSRVYEAGIANCGEEDFKQEIGIAFCGQPQRA